MSATGKLPKPFGAAPASGGSATTSPALHPDALAAPDLARIARREMRRADRTRSPLSLAHFRVAADAGAGAAQLARLWEIVCSNSRETDVPFRVDARTVIVMLLDTDLAGANAFARKIVSQLQDLAPHAIAGEYPGTMFHSLLTGGTPPSPLSSGSSPSSSIQRHQTTATLAPSRRKGT